LRRYSSIAADGAGAVAGAAKDHGEGLARHLYDPEIRIVSSRNV
jgi:hypothetical protein